MGSIIFAVKALIITVAVILLMQVEFGGEKLEYKVADYVRASVISHTVQGVADGAVRVIRDGWKQISIGVNKVVSRAAKSDRPGERAEKFFDFKRQKDSIQEKSQSWFEHLDSRLENEEAGPKTNNSKRQ
jgi:hypothetical protein